MLKCPYCKRLTERGEPTGHRFTYERLERGSKIVSEVRCCLNCINR